MPWSWQHFIFGSRPEPVPRNRPRNPDEFESVKLQQLRARLRRFELALPDPERLEQIADRWEGSRDADYLRKVAARVRKYTGD